MTTYKTHFGVYGVCIREEKLLCINKNTGPYKNRYDLPGGSPKKFEGLVDTLEREVIEETKFSVTEYSKVRCYDSFIQQDGVIVHHIFVLYNIDIKKENNNQLELLNEVNDSSGSLWVEIEKLNIGNSSPVILKLLQEIENDNSQTLLEVSSYKNWIVKE
ncbi:NUDIX hydrolase [Carnobacterium divergens]|uniref:NUDIX hydrolase n=1 Tax=Carnobacterium divergens TaxID=2748 RepID=UPI000D4D8591|nr:NUDIX domain-containing protein [Carnobacterium divergens]MCO6019384.1 NUDIX domain-containing protein [Carnobacterium divergens]MPQ23464.1 NUDIX domain-containing protein [Carnobacterium divergens]TFI62079.1 NUDIX hydrolase [Carnobacterium divergens]TFI86763.1 NUDIX hydrolase [Carnobacterium divergens]TFJ01839.1 NUDIX hydrolase [Carnobacterium divergens]